MSSGFNSDLTGLQVVYSTPKKPIAFYVRGGDNFYEWTDEYPEWVPVVLYTDCGVSGKYFQLAGELYPMEKAVKLLPFQKCLHIQKQPATAACNNKSLCRKWNCRFTDTSVDFPARLHNLLW